MRKFITLTEAAQIAPFSRRKLADLVHDAHWANKPEGAGKWIIDKEAFEEWLGGEAKLTQARRSSRQGRRATTSRSKSTASNDSAAFIRAAQKRLADAERKKRAEVIARRNPGRVRYGEKPSTLR